MPKTNLPGKFRRATILVPREEVRTFPRKRDRSNNLQRKHPITGCRADALMGIWLIDPSILEGYRQLAEQHDLRQMKEMSEGLPAVTETTDTARKFARIEINGPTTKYQTSMQCVTGGTSTLAVQKAIHAAIANPEVGAILLAVDSPGGTVHGAFDLADAIAKAATKKPVICFGSGYVASGAMLSASQCGHVIVTPETNVGSIGVKCVLRDTSKAMDAMGVKIIPIATSKRKEGIEPGVPITEEKINYMREKVDDVHTMFLDYVSRGRKVSTEKLNKLEAETFLGGKAKKIGLIDEVGDEDRAMAVVADAVANPEKYLRKGNDSPQRGQGEPSNQPDRAEAGTDSPDRSNRVMLTPQQLERAKVLTGVTGLTAENADNALFSALEDARKPAISETDAKRSINFAQRGVDMLVKEGKFVPDQAKLLKDKMSVSNVRADGTVMVSVDDVEAVMALNRPDGLAQNDAAGGTKGQAAGTITGANPAPRTTPGESDGKKGSNVGEQPMTLELVNKVRQQHNLRPVASIEELKALAG